MLAMNKHKPIPVVAFATLIKAHKAVTEDRDKLGPGDPILSLARVLHKEHTPEAIFSVDCRLRALAKWISEGQGKPWTYATNDAGHMVNEALFRAAARAPLFEAKTVGDVAFERDEFMKVALEESETDGQA
jgi:hypothetical protein